MKSNCFTTKRGEVATQEVLKWLLYLGILTAAVIGIVKAFAKLG